MWSKLWLFLSAVVCWCEAGIDWQWPICKCKEGDYPISSPYGPRVQTHDDDWIFDWHTGFELPVEVGTNLYAVADGLVVQTGPGYIPSGPIIKIKHVDTDSGDIYFSMIIHSPDILVEEGQNVTQGELIGTSGAEDAAYGHVHFQIRKNGGAQTHCIHPFRVMPFSQLSTEDSHYVQVTKVSMLDNGNYNITFHVKQPGTLLTLNEIKLDVKDSSGNVIETYTHNWEEMTLTASSIADLDNAYQPPFYYEPGYFGVQDYEYAKYDITLMDKTFPDTAHTVVASARSINENLVTHSVELTGEDQNYEMDDLIEGKDQGQILMFTVLSLLLVY